MACARLGPESTISAVDAKRLRGGCLGDVVVRSRNRTRTYNLPVNSRLLCQLSYAGSMLVARPSAGESFWGLATTNLSASGGVLGHSVSGAGSAAWIGGAAGRIGGLGGVSAHRFPVR